MIAWFIAANTSPVATILFTLLGGYVILSLIELLYDLYQEHLNK